MKRILIFVLAMALLLAGCGSNPPPQASVSPSADPTATPLPATPDPTPEPAPPQPGDVDYEDIWRDVTPEQVTQALVRNEEGNRASFVENGHLWRVFKDEPDSDAVLYDVTLANEDGEMLDGVFSAQFVLQQGENFGEVFRGGYGSDLLVSLHGGNYDGDGATEYIVHTYRSFTLCKPDGQDGWISFPFTEDDFADAVNETFRVETTANSLTLTCGGQTATYTLGKGQNAQLSLRDDQFSDNFPLYYSYEHDTIRTSSEISVLVDGFPEDFALLQTTVSFDGENFALTDFQLEQNAGV